MNITPLLALALTLASAQAVTLVDNGAARTVIILPSLPDEFEAQAAAELTEHIEKISGAHLATLSIDPDKTNAGIEQAKHDQLIPICLGRCALPKLEAKLKDTISGAFALRVEKNAVFIAGTEGGTAFGVSELLEQLGVRWFMPGDLGTVIPKNQTVMIKDQDTLQVPSFPSRWFQMPNREWQARVRCGGPVFSGAHGMPAPKFEAEPTFYALIKGERSKRQLCLSNPKLLDYVVDHIKELRRKGKGPIIGLGPNDGGGFCQCDQCKALDGGDFDPFSNEPSVTDRYVWFFDEVLKRLDADYPDTKIAFYIYHSYMRPPVRYKLDPRISGALAPIALDRVHGFSNPVAPEKSYTRWLYQEWGKIMPDLYDRGYWSNLSDPGLPFSIVHRVRDEIPACHEFGVKGWRVETFPNYAAELPGLYIAAKLMWNHQADVDALLQDFADKFFGPASNPMLNYVNLMDAALRDSDCCTGSAWDAPHFYPAKLRAEARTLLAQAAKLTVGKGEYEARVRLMADAFAMLESFIDMLESRADGDFPKAKKALEELDVVAGRLMSMKPVPMVSAGRFSTYVNYMKRFFRPCTEDGFVRVTDGNRLVAAAKDEWDFLMDPLRVGESIGLWRGNVRGGNWQKLKTSSSSWSNQGLRYYKGMAWYRQTVEVPASFKGKRIFLWCGGVDEKSKVWINGKPIGISPGGAFQPFEMDATEVVCTGTNVLTFCVINDVVNELGTGGIVAPAMLYAPAAGKDAKIENARPLGETFP